MVYCPYCGKSVHSQGIDCPECGNRLPEPSGERKLPRIVGEKTAEPDKQPLINNSQYQQPVYQQEYQQHQYQEQPQPAFQQQYYQPHEQEKPEKIGMMPLILVIIGGILAMICAVAVFRTSAMGFIVYTDIGSIDGEFTYLLLVPLSGLLALLIGISEYRTQKKQKSLIIIILGITALIIPLIFAAHLSSEDNLSFGEVFYMSETQLGFSFTNMFIGGILAMIGGLMTIIGGFLFFKKTKKVERSFKVRRPRSI